MTPRQRDNLIYGLVLCGACALAVALMALASTIEQVLP
jgi:hypothetical protein